MQDGDSIKRKDEAKQETIEQAHLLRDTRKHVFLVSNSDTKTRHVFTITVTTMQSYNRI